MKKIRLIMPIAGLSAITAAVIPLASCNNNKGNDVVEVTKAEWNAAFDYLLSISDNCQWKFSDNDSIDIVGFVGEGTEYSWTKYKNFACKNDLSSCEGEMTGSIGDPAKAKCASIKRNGLFFNYVTNTYQERVQKSYHVGDQSTIGDILDTIFNTYIDFEDFTFSKNDGYYTVDAKGEESEVKWEIKSQIKFNKDKKIIDVTAHFALKVVDEQSKQPITTVFAVQMKPQYSNVNPDVSQELIDRATSRVYSMDKMEQQLDLPAPAEENEGILVNITPPQSFNKIVGKTDGEYPAVYFNIVEKNGKILEGGEAAGKGDYYEDGEGNLIFNKTVEKNDTITISMKWSWNAATKLTLKLSTN